MGALGLVADIGGTNTRLGRVDATGVVQSSVVKLSNAAFADFTSMALHYLQGQEAPDKVVIAVAGPVAGDTARLTNRNWHFQADDLAQALGARSVIIMNDLEALGAAVPTVPREWVQPLHDGAELGRAGQALVVGLGTGFNVSLVETRSGVVFSAEEGHASLPTSVTRFLEARLPDASAFETVENLFAGVGMLRLAKVLGLQVESAAEIAQSDTPLAREAVDIVTDAFAIMLRELAYSYFPRAGFFFNGSLAGLVLSEERRSRVFEPLRKDAAFDGQFARLPAFLFTSDYVALGGCAARLLRD